jgi:hypothetical protein
MKENDMKKRRQPKINDELVKRFCHCFSKGCGIGDVCLAIGITEDTFRDWMGRGAAYNRGKYSKFFNAVSPALAYYEMKLVDRVNFATKYQRDWKAAAWMLERLYPDRWGKVDSRRSPHYRHINRESGSGGKSNIIILTADGKGVQHT